MRIFLSALLFVVFMSGISGYYALYTPKFQRPKDTYTYPVEYLQKFESIETRLDQKNNLDELLTLCNEMILTSSDKKVVAKAYFLSSKIKVFQNNLEGAKKDLLYAKEIDFETFKKRATYSFVRSLREFTQYESELFSKRKKLYMEDLKPSIYYVFGLIIFIFLTLFIKTLISLSPQKHYKDNVCN